MSEVYPDRGGGLWEREEEKEKEKENWSVLSQELPSLSYFFLIGLAEITVLRPSSKQDSGNVPNQ